MASATSISDRPKLSGCRRLQLTLVCMCYCLHAIMANGQGRQCTANSSLPLSAPKANLIMNSKLICCKIYISESRNISSIEKIDQAAWSDPTNVVVLSKFGDYFYNRVRYTLISYMNPVPEQGSSPMEEVVSKMVDAAIANIDLNHHSGQHPRMGVIDDVSFHPLGDTKMEDANNLTERVASEIGKKGVSVFLYRNTTHLGKIRRDLGYYRPDSWCSESRLPDILMRIEPYSGPLKPGDNFTKFGATTVGAAPFLEGYNVPIRCENVSKVKDIATKLRIQLGGGGGAGSEGLPKVLSIALPHGDGIVEVACLLDPNHVSANEVQDKVRQIAAEQGLGDKVEKGYYTDITKDMILVNLAVHHQPAVQAVAAPASAER